MDDLKTLETELNAMIMNGQLVHAVEKYYAPGCLFQEDSQTARPLGKKSRKVKLTEFFTDVEKLNSLTLHTQLIGDHTTMSEWTFDLKTSSGAILRNEVLRRRWKRGKVVSEMYYTATYTTSQASVVDRK